MGGMTDLGSFLSAGVGPLGGRVEELVRIHEALWRNATDEPRRHIKSFRRAEKKAVERELSAVVGRLSSEPVRSAFLAGSLEPARLEEMAAGLKPAFKKLLGLIGLPLEAV